ncbi:MAG TPA: PEP-CTERM sorting domain-containing protein [Lacipirellulaceae bacterium]|jgi:hypothetical protein|nr:PEP-CTERM sorting domain-containing protein [Lacipirellulaceae bacterium]
MRSTEMPRFVRLIALIRRALLISLSYVSCPVDFAPGAETQFTAADFMFRVEEERTTFRPGDVVVFDGILTNLSSVAAEFTVNLALVGASHGPEIDGAFVLTFPFIEGYQTGSFRHELLPPGGSLRFPFLFIDTATSTPLGTTIFSGTGNLLFQNIPPSTTDPNGDFFVPISNVTSAIAVPEASSMLLLCVGAMGSICRLRRGRRSRSVAAR